MTEFDNKPRPPDLGDPATDPPMVVRVHPDDDPRDPRARRVIKTDWIRTRPWILVTGSPAGLRLYDEDVAPWPITHAVFYCTAFRHASRGVGAEQAQERGDMDVTAFRTHVDDAKERRHGH